MTAGTQAVVVSFLGMVLVRLASGEAYLRYVNDWMRWPLVASGVLLVVLAVLHYVVHGDDAQEDGHDDGHGHGSVPRVTWLLVLPGLVVFVISPPSLGAYVAERGANDTPPPARDHVAPALPSDDPVRLSVADFVWRAQTDETLESRTVAMSGFVSRGPGGAWYLTRIAIACCAADGVAFRVRVTGAPSPERDAWVRVTGTWVDGSGAGGGDPEVAAASVEAVRAPADPYL